MFNYQMDEFSVCFFFKLNLKHKCFKNRFIISLWLCAVNFKDNCYFHSFNRHTDLNKTFAYMFIYILNDET